MANVKITQLPSATTPLTGTEVFPLVQGTTTKQVAITGLFTSPVMTNPTLGTVGQADLINATGLPISTGVAGLGTGVATFLGTPSSSNLRAAVTDETGTGSLVFATSPTLVTPNLGTPSVLVATNATGTAVGLTAGSAITNANLTGAVTSVGNATSLGSFTSAQLRTALTDETGAGSAVFATSPTITAPILNQINDTNNAQILGLSPTTSAVDYLVVKNGIGVGVPLHFYADGSSANIGLHIQPKGTGLVTISDGTDFNKGIRFRSSGSAASAVTLLDAVSTAGRVVTLPDATTTLVGRDTTDTLTNKTIAFSSNTFSGTLAIANGGTNASTAASAIENLLPAYTGNGSKGLRLNSGATALEWVADGGGTVTSVAATVPSFLSIAGSPITTSGTLAISLSGTALPTTSGGTGLTSFTSGGVVYASSTSALATGSALTFDGTKFTQTASTTAAGGLAEFKNTSTASQTGNISASNDSGTAVSMRVFGSAAGTYGMLTAGSTMFYTTASNLNLVADNASGVIKFGLSGAVESMRLTSTGLGIGTSSPQDLLDISASVPEFRLTSTSGPYSLVTSNTVGTLQLMADEGNTGASSSMRFRVDAAEVARFDSAGNLGLGTSSPQSTYKLSISGTDSVFPAVFLENTTNSKSYSMRAAGTSWIIRDNSVGADRLTVDTAGNLGLGLAPTDTLSYGRAFDIQGTNGSAAYFRSTTNPTTVYGLFSYDNTEVRTNIAAIGASNYLRFISGGSEKARIDSSGNLYVGATALSSDANYFAYSPGNTFADFGHVSGVGSTTPYTRFLYAGSSIGSITQSGTTAVLYNLTSDQRLKENIQDADSASILIDAIQVRQFDWKSDGSHTRYGFIAQELVTVAPEAVHQPADTDEMMAVDYSKLVPMLVKEIQSLRQRVAQLETN
jgi:hypothetical protein